MEKEKKKSHVHKANVGFPSNGEKSGKKTKRKRKHLPRKKLTVPSRGKGNRNFYGAAGETKPL
jgi:hypothetical protein